MIGISVDSEDKNKSFAESLGLTYPVLSDPDRTVSRDYGVVMPIIRLAKRTTFIIDKSGVIRSVHRGREALDPAIAYASCSAAQG